MRKAETIKQIQMANKVIKSSIVHPFFDNLDDEGSQASEKDDGSFDDESVPSAEGSFSGSADSDNEKDPVLRSQNEKSDDESDTDLKDFIFGNGSIFDNKNVEKRKKYKKLKIAPEEEWVVTEKEQKLHEDIFGNKEKLIKNLGAQTSKVTTDAVVAGALTRKAAWNDSDDDDNELKLTSKSKKRNKTQLNYKFEKVAGDQSWAKLDKKRDVDSDDEILQSVGHVVNAKSSYSLPKTAIEMKRLKDLNRSTYAEGPEITSVLFHPTSSVAVVTGLPGLATIYSVDGKKNEKLHSIALNKFQITDASLTVDGNELILGGRNKFFYTYDLLSGNSQHIKLPNEITKLKNFVLSPCGKYFAVIGRFGEIHILHATTKELITTYKQEYECSSLCFSMDSKRLFCHSTDSEVTVFDVRMSRMQHRFIDEGCVNGSVITCSPCNNLLATGSAEGAVNVYRQDGVLTQKYPHPEKSILNLTTKIKSLKFNSTSEILAMCSDRIADAVKMVHFPSGTVFNNFPGLKPNLGYANILSFSPASGYFAVGNLDKQVSLYRLKHFQNY